MSNILDEIVATKRREVAERRVAVPESKLRAGLNTAPPVRDFAAALDRPGTVQVIAEVKKASPSAGVIRADFDPVAIAQTYERHGAACISVLTDAPYFQGDLAYLTQIRQRVGIPVLRKDFIIDRYQVAEARVAGADAVLLIAEVLPGDELLALLGEIRSLGMEALVELYDPENLPRVIASGARLVGVNNRNLRTFITKLEHTLDLAPNVPADRLLVSESGIKTHADVVKLQAGGTRAVLVGETLMRAQDIGKALDELRGVA